MKCLLKRMLDETEFLSDYGVRVLSRTRRDHPYVFAHNRQSFGVGYQPAESTSGLFGGTSNWRGPIWFPVNYLLVESLQKFHYYYGDDFKVECPTGSNKFLTINEVADELSRRADADLSTRRNRPAPRLSAARRARHRSALPRLYPVPRVLRRRYRPRRGRGASDGVDRVGSEVVAATESGAVR